MIVLFLALTDAEPLLNFLHQRGYLAVTRQIQAQIGLERLLPTNALPVLSYRFESDLVGEDIYDPALARAKYEALRGVQAAEVA